MLGAFIVPAIWTFVMVNFEKSALKQMSVMSLSLLVVIAMALPHWLWYGEKNLINAVVLWFVFSALYRVSMGMYRSIAATRSSIHVQPNS
jgi:uncharacterized membrane protein